MNSKVITRSVQRARKLLPYPRIWARFAGAPIPAYCIAGKKAALSRPEAIAFSPSGALMAVSNSYSDSIGLYESSGSEDGIYGGRQCGAIVDPRHLEYVHDLAFSPCGNRLVTAARQAHSLAVFHLEGSEAEGWVAKAIGSMSGQECELHFPASVAVHPSGRWLAVANRMQHGITLYRMSESSGEVEAKPFQSISEEELIVRGLSAPHGMDFSPDGRFLFVAHKRFVFKSHRSKGTSALSVLQCRTEPDLGLDLLESSVFRYESSRVHQVAVHPSRNLVAVANEDVGVEFFDWCPEKKRLTKRETLFLFRIGVVTKTKGISFTRDGRFVVVTTELDEVLFFRASDTISDRGGP